MHVIYTALPRDVMAVLVGRFLVVNDDYRHRAANLAGLMIESASHLDDVAYPAPPETQPKVRAAPSGRRGPQLGADKQGSHNGSFGQ